MFKIVTFFLLFFLNSKKNKIILINKTILDILIFYPKNKNNILKLLHKLLINLKDNLIIFA